MLPRGYINILFVFVPLGIASGVLPWASGFVFVFNLLAILPIAKLFTFTSRKLLDNLSPLLGGVLKALLGNTTMLVVSLDARTERKCVVDNIIGQCYGAQIWSHSHGSIEYAWQYLG
jgi:calcium/proton exchanger cax